MLKLPDDNDKEILGFGDDSYDDNILSLAIVTAYPLVWDRFNKDWNDTLKEFNLSYLHMREIGELIRRNHTISDTEARDRMFKQLSYVLLDHNISCYSASINLTSLYQFNQKHNLSHIVSPYSLAVYGSCIELIENTNAITRTIYLDRTNISRNSINESLLYIKNDRFIGNDYSTVKIATTPDGVLAKSTPALQAADWHAWEARRYCSNRISWEPNEEARSDLIRLSLDYRNWHNEFFRQHGRTPEERSATRHLLHGSRVRGYLWDYENIRGCHINRLNRLWERL